MRVIASYCYKSVDNNFAKNYDNNDDNDWDKYSDNDCDNDCDNYYDTCSKVFIWIVMTIVVTSSMLMVMPIFNE